jgi:hypothetical protein
MNSGPSLRTLLLRAKGKSTNSEAPVFSLLSAERGDGTNSGALTICLPLFDGLVVFLGISAGRGDGVPDNHGDARGILEKRDTTPAIV